MRPKAEAGLRGVDDERSKARRPDGVVVILRLGSGEAAGRRCGPKAALLDRAARAGLPVPPGVIVLDEAWRSALSRGLVRLEGRGARRPVSVPDPSLLVHLIGLPPFTGPLAIRAAFSSEEGGGESVAGDLVPGLFVEGRRPAALAAGLAGVWASACRRPRGFRRDLIAQEMVRASTEGVAFLQWEHEDDIVEAARPTSTEQASGPVAGVPRSLPRLRRAERATEDDPVAVRLQVLLRGVRAAFGDGDWLVEWADDGTRTWLVQIGGLETLPRRREAFTAASHRDLLPEVPSTLMTSLIGSCAPGLFAHCRRFDAGLPRARPLLEIIHGRPLLNLTLLTDMLRRWGLPTWLVTESIGGEADRDFGAHLGRMIDHAPVMARLLGLQARAVRSARSAKAAILERTSDTPTPLPGILDELCWLSGALVREMLALTGALSVPLAVLRRAGVLGEVASRWRFTTSEMADGLDALRARVAGRPELLASLGRGELPDDPGVCEAIETWMARFGHRGVFESDIASPRYREERQVVLRGLAAPVLPRPAPLAPTLASRLLRPVAWHAERLLRAREDLRSTAMIGFERLRRRLLEHSRALADEGTLPSPDALFDLSVEEARRLDAGFRPDFAFWDTRRAEIEAHRRMVLPDVLHPGGEVDDPAEDAPAGEAPRRLEGIGLTAGEVKGRAWVPSDPRDEPPSDLEPARTILVVRAVDLGWLLPLSRVAGVAVEIGGDLSYGSMALREMGLPAVTGVRGLTRAVRPGDALVLNADEGVVERRRPRAGRRARSV